MESAAKSVYFDSDAIKAYTCNPENSISGFRPPPHPPHPVVPAPMIRPFPATVPVPYPVPYPVPTPFLIPELDVAKNEEKRLREACEEYERQRYHDQLQRESIDKTVHAAAKQHNHHQKMAAELAKQEARRRDLECSLGHVEMQRALDREEARRSLEHTEIQRAFDRDEARRSWEYTEMQSAVAREEKRVREAREEYERQQRYQDKLQREAAEKKAHAEAKQQKNHQKTVVELAKQEARRRDLERSLKHAEMQRALDREEARVRAIKEEQLLTEEKQRMADALEKNYQAGTALGKLQSKLGAQEQASSQLAQAHERTQAALQELAKPLCPPTPPRGVTQAEYNQSVAERARLLKQLEDHETACAALKTEHHKLEAALDKSSANYALSRARLQGEFDHKMKAMQQMHEQYLQAYLHHQHAMKTQLAFLTQKAQDEIRELTLKQDGHLNKVTADVDNAVLNADRWFKDNVARLDSFHTDLMERTREDKTNSLKAIQKKAKHEKEQLTDAHKKLDTAKETLFQESLALLRSVRDQKVGAIDDLAANTNSLTQLSVHLDHNAKNLSSVAQRLEDDRTQDLSQRERHLLERELTAKRREDALVSQEAECAQLNTKLGTLYQELQRVIGAKNSGSSAQQMKVQQSLSQMQQLQMAIQEERVRSLNEIQQAQNTLQQQRAAHGADRDAFASQANKERKALSDDRKNLVLAQTQLSSREHDDARRLAEAEALVNAQKAKVARERQALEEQRLQVLADRDAYETAKRQLESERTTFNQKARKITSLGLEAERKAEEASLQVKSALVEKQELQLEVRKSQQELQLAELETAELAKASNRLQTTRRSLQKEKQDVASERQKLAAERSSVSVPYY